MNIEEIKKFLAENADKDEVKSYLAELSKVTADKEKEIVDAFKKSKEYTSEIDSLISRAVNSHDEKAKPKIEKELRSKIELELNPPKDPSVVALQEQLAKLQEDAAQKEATLQMEKKINFYHQKIKPEYKEIFKLFDGSIQDDEERVQFVNKVLYELQTKTAPKPQSSGGTSVAITDRNILKTMISADILQAQKDGRLNSLLGQPT